MLCSSIILCSHLSAFGSHNTDPDFDEPDLGFDTHDKDLTPKKKSFEVNFKVHSPEDIQSYQKQQVAEVSMILGQPPESAAILLRHARWNKEKLIESYMDQQDEVLENAGLGKYYGGKADVAKVPDFTCEICCEDSPDLDTYAMRCGHRFCVNCYRRYLAQKIKDEGEAARIRCPGDGCNKIVDSKSLELLVAEDLKAR